jgi:hypothetical protein
VIPTLLLVGLVLGRWWRIVIPLATVTWIVLVSVAADPSPRIGDTLLAASFAAANVTVGVLLHQLLWRLARGIAASLHRKPGGIMHPGGS